VGPLRYCHQKSEPDWRFRRFAPTRISGDDVDLSKNCRFSDIYIQVSENLFKASFCFEIFWSPLFAIPLARDGLTEK
jgi:hypothetical protein